MAMSWRSRSKERDREPELVSRVHMRLELGRGFALLDQALAGERDKLAASRSW
jgi:hypothetical protein